MAKSLKNKEEYFYAEKKKDRAIDILKKEFKRAWIGISGAFQYLYLFLYAQFYMNL